MQLQRAEPFGLSELMVRPKNTTRASRTNGAKATNKGKAKKLVPVLELGHDARTGSFEVRTQDRAQLPKGYFAHASELNAQMTCVMHGRRESYEHAPMPRMTNTFMENGDYEPEEIVASMKKGIYAVNFGGGQVDITSGKFVFAASEAYLVENGKIGAPVKGATLIGNGPDAMTKISKIGNDMALDSGVGTCGKSGQSVPAGVGQPTVKMGGITVGGTEAA